MFGKRQLIHSASLLQIEKCKVKIAKCEKIFRTGFWILVLKLLGSANQ